MRVAERVIHYFADCGCLCEIDTAADIQAAALRYSFGCGISGPLAVPSSWWRTATPTHILFGLTTEDVRLAKRVLGLSFEKMLAEGHTIDGAIAARGHIDRAIARAKEANLPLATLPTPAPANARQQLRSMFGTRGFWSPALGTNAKKKAHAILTEHYADWDSLNVEGSAIYGGSLEDFAIHLRCLVADLVLNDEENALVQDLAGGPYHRHPRDRHSHILPERWQIVRASSVRYVFQRKRQWFRDTQREIWKAVY